MNAHRQARLWREANHAKLQADDPRHGTTTLYDHYLCRCPPCRAAKALAMFNIRRYGHVTEPDEVRCVLCHVVWPRRHPDTPTAVLHHLQEHRS